MKEEEPIKCKIKKNEPLIIYIAVEGWIIFVRNIHEESNEEDIFDLFSDFGEILNLHLNLDHESGFVKGYAFIEYKTKEEGELAIKEMNSKEYREKPLKVSWTFSKK